MKMNYNSWFYDQYNYLKGSRNNKETYNDTKWNNVYERYKSLIDSNSHLLNEQPFGVVGNDYGFERLIDLMVESNYSFEDINKSLIDTFDVSLKNAMGRMMVNTHAVMFACKSNTKQVSNDKFSYYYIIEAPFNQLHFGDRDEFIRQRLNKMHTTENEFYMSIDEFNDKRISDILGFTIVCVVNGLICNDCKIAFDDKGFKFKIGWKYTGDVIDFMVFKLDKSFYYQTELDINDFNNKKNILIKWDKLNGFVEKFGKPIGTKCFINLYDKNFSSTSGSVPNFGEFVDLGLSIKGLQNKTVTDIEMMKSSKLNIGIYGIKYLNEVPNVYPAVNYLNMIDSRYVYDNKGEHIKTISGKYVKSSKSDSDVTTVSCTPPIILNRESSTSFDVINKCLSIKNVLMRYEGKMLRIGECLSGDINDDIASETKTLLNEIINVMKKQLNIYLQGSILTSLVRTKYTNEFKSFVNTLEKCYRGMINANNNYEKYYNYAINEFYDENYKYMIDKLTYPFENSSLKVFHSLQNVMTNFTDIKYKEYQHYTRPVSEQCFISLKYDEDYDSWLFYYPKLTHFHGIDNVFYVDEGLKGDELFKFFVLYTDTEDPSITQIEPMKMDEILDYDLFCNEIEKYQSYIKYWNAENHLMKYCNIIFGKYDDETITHMLSKILNNKIVYNDMINVYPSDIEYEQSSISSSNIGASDDSPLAPFAINFLFYTLNIMNTQDDELQEYFFNRLTKRRYQKRYQDIDISELLKDRLTTKINYSSFCKGPDYYDLTLSNPYSSDDQPDVVYCGIPLMISNGQTIPNRYPYVFNVLENYIKYHAVLSNDISDEYYLMYRDIHTHITEYTYNCDFVIAKYVTQYLSMMYQYINELQTNYTKTFNVGSICSNCFNAMDRIKEEIDEYVKTKRPSFMNPKTQTIIDKIKSINEFNIKVLTISNSINSFINMKKKDNTIRDIFTIANEYLQLLKRGYIAFGYFNDSLKQIRALYIHMKEINSIKNLFELKEWLQNIDTVVMDLIPSVIAKNENNDININKYKEYSDYFKSYISKTDMLDLIKLDIEELGYNKPNSFNNELVEYCKEMMNIYSFDLYTIKHVKLDSYRLSFEPTHAIVSVDTSDKHFKHPLEEDTNEQQDLYFMCKYESSITSINPICAYTIFDGSEMEVDITFYGKNNLSETKKATISFMKVATTSNDYNSFNQIIDTSDIYADFQNIHESFDINEDGLIVNKKHATMNYEMLIENHFTPLSHTEELILDRVTKLPGSIDRVSLNSSLINSCIGESFGNYNGAEMWFKPNQIMHNIDGVGGPYYQGQKIFMSTDDGFIFPCIVNTVSHSRNQGFIEASVDSYNTSWMKVTDKEFMNTLLDEPIECTVIDDNVSNFLNEFNNHSYPMYTHVNFPTGLDVDPESTVYTLPGDPMFVLSNAPYVYERLSYIFNEIIPNRFMNDTYKTYNFKYLGTINLNTEDTTAPVIGLLNYDFNTLTDPEMYPILRQEPNDHDVWDDEVKVFTSYAETFAKDVEKLDGQIISKHQEMMDNIDNKDLYESLVIEYEELNYKRDYKQSMYNKMVYMIKQLEQPTTWHNVRSYDAAVVYIENGRADNTFQIIPGIKDISFGTNDMGTGSELNPYTVTEGEYTTQDNLVYYVLGESLSSKTNIVLYDWENKKWLLPEIDYNTRIIIGGNVKNDRKDDYVNNVVNLKLEITSSSVTSKNILVYVGFNDPDIFVLDNNRNKKCQVMFKPIMSLDKPLTNYDPYDDLRIRKHFDANETYHFTSFSDVSDIDIDKCYKVIRPMRSGKYQHVPVIRMCDLKAYTETSEYDYNDFDLYLPLPFERTKTIKPYKVPTYRTSIMINIDSFVDNTNVTLICISNNSRSSFNGNISTVMFEATLHLENGRQTVQVYNSNLMNFETGEYICMVKSSSAYKSVGGIIKVNVTNTTENVLDTKGHWLKVPNAFKSYKELPDTFILVPHDNVDNTDIHISFKNEYIKDIEDTMMIDNTNINNPFEYYYDISRNLKYPLTDMNDKRLVIDQTSNPTINLIKSTYIGVCRYSLKNIPENGIIDMTSHIPTPISRDRYEFYVNGRNISDPKDVIILSPTSIQLCNLTSLRNFELVELVDEYNDSIINRYDSVFVSYDGTMFNSYDQALLYNNENNYQTQYPGYTFNVSQHDSINDYTNNIINPNNIDIEDDILDYIIKEQSSIIDYNELINIPTINGIELKHPSLTDLGFKEVDNTDIYELFDSVWKKEITTNPLFVTTHHINSNDNHMELHVSTIDKMNIKSETRNKYVVYMTGDISKFSTLYITLSENGKIDDYNETRQIIPYVSPGMVILIDNLYTGYWIHSTDKSIKPKKIQ